MKFKVGDVVKNKSRNVMPEMKFGIIIKVVHDRQYPYDVCNPRNGDTCWFYETELAPVGKVETIAAVKAQYVKWRLLGWEMPDDAA